MTGFPYGFPTSYSRPFSGGIIWPRCVNAEPGTFGHECGKPATCVGTNHETGAQAALCDHCAMNGSEGRKLGNLQSLGVAPVAVGSYVTVTDAACAYAGHCAQVLSVTHYPPQPTPIALVKVRPWNGAHVTFAVRTDKLRLRS